MKVLPLFLISLLLPLTSSAADPVKPLKALLVIGGCCHDYATQKEILKTGLEKRLHLQVEVVYSDDKGTKYQFPLYAKPNWAQGYDVVIHDECTADVKDPAFVDSILAEHRRGVPAVLLHCAMHSYRTGTPVWFEFCGIQSSSHGPQVPIEVTHLDLEHPVTRGTASWTTIKEELYNNIRIFDTAKPLARGKQRVKDKDVESVVTWTNHYGNTRVFATTLGHNNETVADDRYLDLVSRGLLWACDKLEADGQPKAGYGK